MKKNNFVYLNADRYKILEKECSIYIQREINDKGNVICGKIIDSKELNNSLTSGILNSV